MTIAYWKKGSGLVLMLLAGSLNAADELVDGNYGLLHVRGALTESACRLEMDSAWQEVDMGTTATVRLKSQATRVRRCGWRSIWRIVCHHPPQYAMRGAAICSGVGISLRSRSALLRRESCLIRAWSA
ncbi:type-1 fimbrial protein [Enterobacter cloacae]|uniref:Type-1 fimbrial protein n=1 Tax=Enterobacter cloacae TaxID=550 RepID=A0A377M8S9_ENTCL|nr:type-1 fimbrial protein [Enterobacter cloacae]